MEQSVLIDFIGTPFSGDMSTSCFCESTSERFVVKNNCFIIFGECGSEELEWFFIHIFFNNGLYQLSEVEFSMVETPKLPIGRLLLQICKIVA